MTWHSPNTCNTRNSPPVSEDGSHGQHELIQDDVRAVSDAVVALASAAGAGERRKQHWVGGWMDGWMFESVVLSMI